jgi:hypothetical protein
MRISTVWPSHLPKTLSPGYTHALVRLEVSLQGPHLLLQSSHHNWANAPMQNVRIRRCGPCKHNVHLLGTAVHVTPHRTRSLTVSNRSSLPMSQNPR